MHPSSERGTMEAPWGIGTPTTLEPRPIGGRHATLRRNESEPSRYGAEKLGWNRRQLPLRKGRGSFYLGGQ